jgi:HSF-type DNA-binding
VSHLCSSIRWLLKIPSLASYTFPSVHLSHPYRITQLMLMLLHIEKLHREMPDQAPAGWVNHNSAFAVHNTDRLCNDWIPLFFRPCKFSSFRRKLFRWEFRLGAIVDETDMNLIPAASQEIVFCNENFKRDQKHLLSHMKSVTAEKTAEKEELELRMSLGNDMPSDEQHQKLQEDQGRGGRLQKQQQQENRLVQGPPLQGTAVGPGYSGSFLPYSSMLIPPPHGSDSIHFRQQTLQHGPAVASYLQQQEQEPTTTTQPTGMTTIPANDDAMIRQVLAEAATKVTAAGHQPRQQKQMAALGGQQPSLATAQYQQQHNAYSKDQPQLHEGGRASADNHDVADNDVLWHSRQTTTLPQQHAAHQEQLQNLLAWQSRQMSQLRGSGGGSGEAHPPINNGGGGSGDPDLMTNPQERRIWQQLLLGASVPQQQHSAPYESGGRSGSHFGLPGGNPW